MLQAGCFMHQWKFVVGHISPGTDGIWTIRKGLVGYFQTFLLALAFYF